jgi:TonB family protein
MSARPETPVSAEPELHLCLLADGTGKVAWDAPFQIAGVLSILLHIFGFAGLVAMPSEWLTPPRLDLEMAELKNRSVPLVAPRFELTQREKNQGKVTKELSVEQLQANLHNPAPASAPSRPQMMSLPPAPRQAAIPAPIIEPPRMEAAARAPQPPAPLGTSDLSIQANMPPPAPPPAQQQEPKLVLETPGSPAGVPGGIGTGLSRVPPPPKGTVEEAAHQAMRRGGAGLVLGDSDTNSPLSSPGGAQNLPGKNGSSVELLSDPMGTDFRSYLIQVLASVRRNWMAVIPESARMGRRGKVLIQFSINRQGQVPKLVIAMPSGAEALDRAAVAGISASNPFPPLPPDFRGEHIRLQLAFMYNTAR